ncbi:MAG: NAD(P)H-dependent oxidoreductase [Hyphomicrobiales bacterium]|nr:NAD(P)H-dependent oxidoreductase [Hyphomicrobiales bacterium]
MQLRGRRKNAREVAAYIERLHAADGLVLVFPVWFDGLPAIVQGYFQRVFLPGVATAIDENGLFHPNLGNFKRLAASAPTARFAPTSRRNMILRVVSSATTSVL